MVFLFLCIVNALVFLWFVINIFLKSNYTYKNKEENEIVEMGVVLGSGGHTYEMIQILKHIKNRNIVFNFFYSHNDNLSKIKTENELLNYEKNFFVIPRCRNVGDSYCLSFIKLIYSFLYCIFLTYKMNNMKVIIVNGPGVCVPVVYSLIFRKYIFLKKIKIVYIESICRVYSLSLSAKLLYYFADMFVVFSEHLQKKYKKAKCYGYFF
ncbi:dolichol-linked oligosaccharide biosynthesis enzyme, putative [Plasmodium sp. gorilla clade G2]|uniref:dolichol-linked oligosaccharide biosynthesis enzyme, putative n=1 Tax=Plasmodium sp. gorilla clade G2 TaxID=880535 RepID=UPI000D2170E7|nr:dolichol-linked oligosaccharide biosynthesis enzyme, putative [Plasmodium sp. gorilla clade G2]SOV10568.1 dolichol-linked oligosaccharide biosynthesis enzyme, putative [Plasmodium sp. gorilla clade G2]